MTADELAHFLVTAAATVGRLGLTLGPDEGNFRDLAIADMVDGIPLFHPLDGVREQLLAGADPGAALSEAFARQAVVYVESAALATVAVVERALKHLQASGGDEVVAAFLDDLEGVGEQPAA
ncbi:hypothetical protein GCM10009817_32720 [Terrabacter lapilli]|uniref:Uncharacterized protein n=1 Tax=Terrabacter lapilli TaxID=436231 RepID=A0ABN2SL50_9MICO